MSNIDEEETLNAIEISDMTEETSKITLPTDDEEEDSSNVDAVVSPQQQQEVQLLPPSTSPSPAPASPLLSTSPGCTSSTPKEPREVSRHGTW